MKINELDQKLQDNPEFVQAMDDLKLHFELANAVLRARLKKGWSQTELAKAVGTQQANISKIESGLANPTLAFIHKLVKALDMNVYILETPSYSQVNYSVDTFKNFVQTSIYKNNLLSDIPNKKFVQKSNVKSYEYRDISNPPYKLVSDAIPEREVYHI